MKTVVFFYKAIRKMTDVIVSYWDKVRTHMLFNGNGVDFTSFRTSGVPYVMVARNGKMVVGNQFAMNNGMKGNPIGCYERCTFFVDNGAEIIIGENVGISQTALVSHCSIRIGDNVKMGGGYFCIYN